MRRFLILVLSLAATLSLALTTGCEKAKEKAVEMKDKAAEKAEDIKGKAAEKAGEMKDKALDKVVEKAEEMKEKAGGWNSCKGCHTDSGKPAPSKADLLRKFKTEKELISAAKAEKNPMMSDIKGNDALLKAAAKDLGLK